LVGKPLTVFITDSESDFSCQPERVAVAANGLDYLLEVSLQPRKVYLLMLP